MSTMNRLNTSSSPMNIPGSPSPLLKEQPDNTPKNFLGQISEFCTHWLIMPKILYFILNMYVYGFHSLLQLIFVSQWKFPFYMYGFASAIVSMNFFGAMLWTSLADKTGKYKLIIISTTILYTLCACGLIYFQPPLEGLTKTKMILVFVGFGFFNFFLSAAFPLVDSLIMGMLTTYPNVSREQFGNQRMFGAVGHFASTMISMSKYNGKDPFPIIIFQSIISSIFIVAVLVGIRDVKPVKHGHGHGKESEKEKPGTIRQVPLTQSLPMAPTPAPPSAAEELTAEGTAGQRHPVIALISSPNFMFFMLFIACMGVVRSVSGTFQKLIADQMSGGNNKKTAILDFGRMLSEMFVYLIAKQMKDFMGIYWILIFSQVMGILRLLGYSLTPATYKFAYRVAWVYELIKGFGSGLVSSSAIPIASRIAPPGCESTAQGLYTGNYAGISAAIAGVFGGIVLGLKYYPLVSSPEQCVHTQDLFFYVVILCSTVTLAMSIKYIFVDRVMGLPGYPRKASV